MNSPVFGSSMNRTSKKRKMMKAISKSFMLSLVPRDYVIRPVVCQYAERPIWQDIRQTLEGEPICGIEVDGSLAGAEGDIRWKLKVCAVGLELLW